MIEGYHNSNSEEIEQMITSLKIHIEEDKIIEETFRSQLEEKEKMIGSKNSLFKERSSEERYAAEEHQNKTMQGT
jgi:hypothetical protein